MKPQIVHKRPRVTAYQRYPDYTMGRALELARQALGRTARAQAPLEAEMLLSHATQLPRPAIISKPSARLSVDQAKQFRDDIVRRRNKEPMAYIIGKRAFWKSEFTVNKSVLIPRPCTELLVERGLALVSSIQSKDPQRVLELGVGSGCVLLSLVADLPAHWRGLGVDISPDAIATARLNATRLGIADRITLVESEWLAKVPTADLTGRFDLVVSNPPYLTRWDMKHRSKALKYEPKLALAAGDDGLKCYREIAALAEGILKPKAHVVLEVGAWQMEDVVAVFAQKAPSLAVTERLKDLEGHNRALVFQFTPK